MAKINNPLRPLLDRASEAWNALSLRERRMIGLLTAAFLATVVVLSFVSVRKNIAARESSIAQKQTTMEQVGLLANSFREAEAARLRIESRIKGQPVRLFSYLEDLAKKQNLAVGDMQDRGTDNVGEGITRSTVEVNFARIDLPSLTAFMNEIEKSQHLVKVEKFRLRGRNDDPNLLDASLTVSTYQLSES